MESNLIQKGDNPDITIERQKATFSVNKLAAFIHGDETIVARRHEILKAVENEPQLNTDKRLEFLPRQERNEEQARRSVAMSDCATDIINAGDFFGEGLYYQGLVIGRDLHPMSLHYGMVLTAIQNQCDDEQVDEWLPLIISRAIVATYAQTELGHGTNLKKLETTATYDPKTQEFIIDSPTITSTKWWPGGLGKSSNYAVIMAQLYTEGKWKGPHPFFVQIRDLNTHEPLPGVIVGDIGPKFGINGSDNGFLRFNKLHVPRKAMLMRNAKVLPNGKYVPPKHAKLGFGAMVFVRSIMIKDQAMQLGSAVTIATRYSAVRRQGEINPNEKEVKILDYQTQQLRLFPNIAKTLVFLFAANEVKSLYEKVIQEMQEGNLELLPHLHGISSGLKSVVTWEVAQGIEQSRLSCGGHGYSLASALPDIYTYAVGGCTYEGENIVMLLQVAKGLLKLVPEIRSRKAKLTELTSYLGCKSSNKSDFTCVNSTTSKTLINDFEHVARQQLFHAYDLLKANENKMSNEEAWNMTSIELCKASRLHVKAYLIKNYFNYVSKCNDISIRIVLEQLGKLYTLDNILTHYQYFSINNYYNDEQLVSVKNGIYHLLKEIRPNAVAIVDSFDFSDRELNSVLGKRDGNVYQSLFEWAKSNPFNQSDISTGYLKHLKPMMEDGRSKL